MKFILKNINFKSLDTSIQNKDIQVHFEYEYLDINVVKFILYAYIGIKDEKCRFLIEMYYEIFLDKHFYNDIEMIEEIVDKLIPAFTKLIIYINDMI